MNIELYRLLKSLIVETYELEGDGGEDALIGKYAKRLEEWSKEMCEIGYHDD